MDHHRARWGVVIPLVYLTKILPNTYINYYIFPIVFYSLFTALIAGLVSRTIWNDRYFLGLLVVLVSVDPMSHASASQINTTVFGLLYAVIGLLSFSVYIKTTSIRFLLCAAFFLVLSYGSHLSYISFSLAPLMYLLINKGNKRVAVFYSSFLALFFLVETVLFNQLSGWSLVGGRLEVVTTIGGHFNPDPHYKDAYELTDFLNRWRLVPKYNFLIAFGFLIAVSTIAIRSIRNSIPVGIWLTTYAALCYGAFVTFAVQDLNPLMPVQPLLKRYLAPFFPFALPLLIFLFFSLLKRCNSEAYKPVTMFTSTVLLVVFFTGSSLSICREESSINLSVDDPSSYASATYCKIFRYSKSQIVYPSVDAFVFRARHFYDSFFSDYQAGKVAIYDYKESSAEVEKLPSRILSFSILSRLYESEIKFLKTKEGTFSSDGESKKDCVWELAQTKTPKDNYRECGLFSEDKGV